MLIAKIEINVTKQQYFKIFKIHTFLDIFHAYVVDKKNPTPHNNCGIVIFTFYSKLISKEET